MAIRGLPRIDQVQKFDPPCSEIVFMILVSPIQQSYEASGGC